MTKEDIIMQVKALLFEHSRGLSRGEYRDMLDEVGSDIDSALDALEEEEACEDEE